MKIAQVIATFVGGSSLYLIMAACSASKMTTSGSDGPSSGDPNRIADGSFEAAVNALTDALIDPVADAKAGTPDVAVENCNKTVGPSIYAEHSYPGKTVNDLTPVQVALHYASVPAGLPSGYEHAKIFPTYVKDGAVAVFCTSPSDTVVFVLSQP